MELCDESKWEIFDTVPIENRHNFWKPILLSVVKPHLINRRLAGAEQLYIGHAKSSRFNANWLFIKRVASYITENCIEEIDVDFIKRILVECGLQDEFSEINGETLSKCDLNYEQKIIIVLNKLLPKNLTAQKCTFEVNILGN